MPARRPRSRSCNSPSPEPMKPLLFRLLSDHGMLLVLGLLCAFFSVATYSEQSPVGEVAARQLAATLPRPSGPPLRVLIVARALPDDSAFADRLAADLAASGVRVLATVKGEPMQARAALQEIAAAGWSLRTSVMTSRRWAARRSSSRPATAGRISSRPKTC